MILNRKALLAALNASRKIAGAKGPRPILHNVMLAPHAAGLRLSVTDGERWLTLDVPAESGDLLPACVPHASLSALVKARKDATVALDMLDDKRLRVDVAVILTDDPELWPAQPIPAGPETAWYAATLAQGIDRVSFAAARAMGRYAFNGILVDVRPEGAVFVGTDGRRLAVQRTALNELPACKPILPVSALAVLRSLIGKKPAGVVGVCVSDNVVRFDGPTWSLTTDKLEGEFPDWEAVMPKPKDVPRSLIAPRDALLAAVLECAVTAGAQGRAVELTPGEPLGLYSRHEGVGETGLAVSGCVAAEGPECHIRYNPEFLSEALERIPEGSGVTWHFKDRASAAVLDSTGAEGFTYVLMPITS